MKRRFAGVLLFAAALLFAAPALAQGDAGPLAAALRGARARDLAQSRMWRVLLHYRPSLTGTGWKSNADGLGFFYAGAAGRTDPQAELDATLTALFATPAAAPETKQPQCLFPARTAWLRAQLGLDAAVLPARRCPLYEFWSGSIAARSATLVYATAYLNSPASMYGHTFLRLSRSTGEGNPLLDYIINYAADVDTNNGIVYAAKGVTGGFRGYFYVMPYYVKVQEYSNMESRDLWEYELSLSTEQVQRLVAHAWETRSTHFDYYFFSRNCSYYLLELLEVADPDLHLVDDFHAWVIPSDTVRVVLAQPGLVRRRAPRPAILSTMSERRATLDKDEVDLAERWAKLPAAGTPPDEAARTASRQARTLDAAYDYMRFREGLKKAPTDDFKLRERRLLLARGRTGVPPMDVVVQPAADAPEEGHPTLRATLGGGFSNASGPFERLSFRGALHDYLDPTAGYPTDATLVMGQVVLQYDDPSRRLRLDRVDALDIVSALPFDRWVHGASWKVWAGADNARELGCDGPARNPNGFSCLYAGVTTGGGFSARLGPRRRVLTFAFAETDLGAGPPFEHDLRLGVGAEAGAVADATSFWRWELTGRYLYYPLGDRAAHARVALGESLRLVQRLSLRAGIAVAGTYAEASAELVGYF